MVVVVHTQVMYLAVVIMGLYVAFLLDSRVGGGRLLFRRSSKKKKLKRSDDDKTHFFFLEYIVSNNPMPA